MENQLCRSQSLKLTDQTNCLELIIDRSANLGEVWLGNLKAARNVPLLKSR